MHAANQSPQIVYASTRSFSGESLEYDIKLSSGVLRSGERRDVIPLTFIRSPVRHVRQVHSVVGSLKDVEPPRHVV
jgi:hypothetical protein